MSTSATPLVPVRDLSNHPNKRQAIFDIVARHLLSQGERSEYSDGECAYRGEDQLTCAVGCLIADEFYRPNLEGATVYNDNVLAAVCDSMNLEFHDVLKDKTAAFLEVLQITHDSYKPDEWEKRLTIIADKHGLEMPTIRTNKQED